MRTEWGGECEKRARRLIRQETPRLVPGHMIWELPHAHVADHEAFLVGALLHVQQLLRSVSQVLADVEDDLLGETDGLTQARALAQTCVHALRPEAHLHAHVVAPEELDPLTEIAQIQIVSERLYLSLSQILDDFRRGPETGQGTAS